MCFVIVHIKMIFGQDPRWCINFIPFWVNEKCQMHKYSDLLVELMLKLNFILLLERIVLKKSMTMTIWSFVKLSKHDLNCVSCFASKSWMANSFNFGFKKARNSDGGVILETNLFACWSPPSSKWLTNTFSNCFQGMKISLLGSTLEGHN